jgi:hypothetical protein
VLYKTPLPNTDVPKNDTACESDRTRKPQRTRSEARYYPGPRRSKETRNKQVPRPQCKLQNARAVLLCSVFAETLPTYLLINTIPSPTPSTFDFTFFFFLFFFFCSFCLSSCILTGFSFYFRPFESSILAHFIFYFRPLESSFLAHFSPCMYTCMYTCENSPVHVYMFLNVYILV